MSSGGAGLYRHAIEIRRRGERDIGAGDTDGTDGGLTHSERREIETSIDDLFNGRRVVPLEDSPHPSLKSGALFPVLVNILVAAVVIGALVVFVLPQREALATDGASADGFITTEGFVVERVMEQTAQEISARETRIARIQQQLEALQQERSSDAEGDISEDEAALQAELDRLVSQLEQQRAQADTAALRTAQTSEIQQRLREMEQRREDETFILSQLRFIFSDITELLEADHLDGARTELDGANALLARHRGPGAAPSSETLAILEYGTAALDEAIGLLMDARESDTDNAPVVTEELKTAEELKERADALMDSGQTEEAEQLYRTALATIPVSDGAFSVLESLWLQERNNLINSTDNNLQEQREQIRSLQSELGSARRSAASLRSELSDRIASLQSDLAMTRQQAQTFREELLARETGADHVESNIQRQTESLVTGFPAAPVRIPVRDDENVADLIETKILIREVLNSDAVRQDYPELYTRMESYMRVLGEQKAREGQIQGLGIAVDAVRELAGGLGVTSSESPGNSANAESVPVLERTLVLELSRLLTGIVREVR